MLPQTPATGYKLFALSMTIFAIGDGIGNIAIKAGFSPPLLNVLRYALLAILILGYTFYSGKAKEVFFTDNKKTLILRGCFQGFGTILYFSAFQFIPLSMAASIFFCAPIALLAVSPFVLDEKVGLRQWFTVLLGFSGMFCIINPFALDYSTIFSDTSFIGFAFALTGMFSFMSVQLLTKKVSGKVSTTSLLFWGNAISCVVSSIFTLFFLPNSETITSSSLLAILFMSLFALLGQILFVTPYKYVRASDLAPLNYIQLAVTIIIGIFFFEERPPFLAYIGMAFIITAGTLQGFFASRGIK